MKRLKLLLWVVIFFILTLIISSRNNLPPTPLSLFNPAPAYAQSICGCSVGSCYLGPWPPGTYSGSYCPGGQFQVGTCGCLFGISSCCTSGCTVQTSCSGWSTPSNTCYNGNSTQTCTHTNRDCSKYSWTNYQTVDACLGPRYTCVAATCVPWWTLTGQVTDSLNGGGVGGISVTAGGRGTTTGGGGGYGFYYAFRTGCYTVSIGLPNNYILTGPGSKGFCVGGDKVRNFTVTRVYTISGKVYDPANNKGIPGIAVHVAGHTVTTNGNGDYTFPYSDHIIRGNYTVTVTVPNCWDGLTTSRGVTVGPNRTGINLTMTKQYTIAGKVYDPYNGNAGKGGVAVHVIGKTTTTNGNGDYLFTCAFNIHAGRHTVSITIPAGYTNTTATSRNATVGPNWTNNATGIDFGVTKLFTVSGDVFVDSNIDGVQQGSESNYPARPSINFTNTSLRISQDQEYITTRTDGSYTIYNVITSNMTVSYNSLPAGYYMTSPLNGPPPSFRVHPGFGCSTNGAPGATCNAGDINNLSFGIVNDRPWIQSVCGDIRMDNGFSNPEPLIGGYAIITNGSCTNPGVLYTGDTNATFGKGNASTSNEIVGGAQYPEVYNSTGTGSIFSSYSYLTTKAQTAGIATVNLSSKCNLTNCSLPGNLAHGIYKANSNVTLNGYTFPANQDYVILINGNLTINGNIIVPTSSSVMVATTGDIIVKDTVGSGPTSNAPNLEGIYTSDKSLILQPNLTRCQDVRFNIQGSMILNATQRGGGVQNFRNLCRFNALYPTLQITQRLDFLLNLPEFLRTQQTTSQEVAP